MVRLTRAASAGQLEVHLRDEGRLASENAALHARLIADGESADRAKRQHDEEKRALEARVAELLFWKSRTVERHSTLEQARSTLSPNPAVLPAGRTVSRASEVRPVEVLQALQAHIAKLA